MLLLPSAFTFQKILSSAIRVSNGLDKDQDQGPVKHFITGVSYHRLASILFLRSIEVTTSSCSGIRPEFLLVDLQTLLL